MATRIPAGLSPTEGRRFGLQLGIAFLILAALAWWRGHTIPPIVTGILGTLLVVAALITPTSLGPAHRWWMGLGTALSRITNPILLALIYMVVLTPVGLLKRLFGRRAITREKSAPTFWIARPVDMRRRTDMEHQF